MKCFEIFKYKSKSNERGTKSAPEQGNRNRLDHSDGNRTAKSLPSPRSIPELYKEKEHNLRVFTLQELREATSGFHRMLKVGEGGFGSVYKGKIKPANGVGDPLVVAIKRLNKHGLQVFSASFSVIFYSFVFINIA